MRGVFASPTCRLWGHNSLRKQFVPNVARSWCQPDSARLAPDRSIDLVLVADLQRAGRVLGQENRVTHLAAGPLILCLHFFPELHRPQLELRQFFPDLSAQALPFALSCALATARKHPEPIAPSSDQEHAAFLRDNKF